MEINKKKSNSIWIVAGVILVVIVAVIIGMISYSNSPEQKYLRQIKMAERYLEDLDYEQAVAAYRAAIEIDPKEETAYLGMADAYIAWANEKAGTGDVEGAVMLLEQALAELDELERDGGNAELIGRQRERIMEALEQWKKPEEGSETPSEIEIQDSSSGQDMGIADISDFVIRYEPIMRAVAEERVSAGTLLSWDYCNVYAYTSNSPLFFSIARMKEIYEPMIRELEYYLEDMDKLGLNNQLEGEEWAEFFRPYCNDPDVVYLPSKATEYLLRYYYLFIGEMEKCKELAVDDTYVEVDQYGRPLICYSYDGEISMEFAYDGNHVIWYRADTQERNYEYDEQGRMVYENCMAIDDQRFTEWYYSYPDDNTVIVETIVNSENKGREQAIIDQYGYVGWDSWESYVEID